VAVLTVFVAAILPTTAAAHFRKVLFFWRCEHPDRG
jgi:hypothetical protein